MAKNKQRDEYLPSPEVCDWLLEQEWSKPATVHVNSPESTGWRDDSCRATAALGRDGVIELLAFAEDLEMLREDQRQRAEAIDRKRASILADEQERKAVREQSRAGECDLSSSGALAGIRRGGYDEARKVMGVGHELH